jgi:hypothetical protein
MRAIVADSIYASLADKIANRKELDDSLVAVYWALKNNAEDFPVMRGFQTLRMVKTDPVRNIPALHVIFRINAKDEVQLRYIEISDSDEFQGPPMM